MGPAPARPAQGVAALLPECSGTGTACPAWWRSPHPRGCARTARPWHCRRWFDGYGGVGSVGSDLRELFPPNSFCGSVIWHISAREPSPWQPLACRCTCPGHGRGHPHQLCLLHLLLTSAGSTTQPQVTMAGEAPSCTRGEDTVPMLQSLCCHPASWESQEAKISPRTMPGLQLCCFQVTGGRWALGS